MIDTASAVALTFGLSALTATVGFVLGVAWGVNFATAKEARDEANRPADTALLSPQFWSNEKIAAAIAAQGEPKGPLIPDYPAPYRSPGEPRPPGIPGLEDG